MKLGGLLGLALGWLSWSTLVVGVFLGWTLAGLTWLLLRLSARDFKDNLLPAGPFLVIGAVAAIGIGSAH